MTVKQPWMKYYPSDWRADAELRLCGLGARGLWIEMLGIMHEAAPRGSLLVNGKRPSARQLAVLAGAGIEETETCLHELEEAGVFSIDPDGTVYSRRMRRDVKKAEEDKANGAKGGNPSLIVSNNAPVNPSVNTDDKAQKLEARGSEPKQEDKSRRRPPYDPAAAAAHNLDFAKERKLCEEAANAEYPDFQSIIDLLQEGVDLEGRVLPIILDVAEKSRKSTRDPPQSWLYFEKAIRDKNRVIRHSTKANGHAIPNPDDPLIRVSSSISWLKSELIDAGQKFKGGKGPWLISARDRGDLSGWPPDIQSAFGVSEGRTG